MPSTRLNELRHLLFGDEQKRIEEIGSRVEQAEFRVSDVAEVLPESITASFERDPRLIGALRAPVKQCVSESIRENPEDYANVLFPVMGPAIRRAIAEAFKGLTQQINQAIEHSVSPRGLRWRLEAWRAGVPFTQYILQKSLLYRVEHVYLIQANSGLLISNVHRTDAEFKDEDAVSAMFTAIQEFVKDSFSQDEPQRLRTAELGELVLWAVHSPNCVLVAVIRGEPPARLRDRLQAVVERLETTRSELLRDFSGDRESSRPLDTELRTCLVESSRELEDAKPSGGFSPALAVVAVVALVIVGFLVYGTWMNMRADSVRARLEATPGLVVTGMDRNGRTLRLTGLRDPLAADPQQIALDAGWRGSVAAELEPYYSLENSIVLERSRRRLAPPASVALRLDDATLFLTGVAEPDWIDRAAGIAIPGIDTIEISGLSADRDARLGQLTALLAPPETVRLSLIDAVLHLEGEAPFAWITGLPEDPSALPSVARLDVSALRPIEQRQLQQIAAEVARSVVDYEVGQTTASDATRAELAALAEPVARFVALAESLGRRASVNVTGHSDESGSPAANVAIERARAEDAAGELIRLGVPATALRPRSQLASAAPGQRAAAVTLSLEAEN